MSPFLLGPDIIGEDVVKLPISNNDPVFKQKTHGFFQSSVPSQIIELESEFDHHSNLVIGEALRAKINSVDVDSCAPGGEDSFFVADLGRVYRQYKRWINCLPRIDPCYALKCNGDPNVVRLLAKLGLGFDCASKMEIDTVLALGVSPDRIVYAHPCKAASYVRHARSVDVKHMTFDNADELYKCKKNFPGCKMLLRIMTDDSKSLCQFSIKYGASLESAFDLLQLAKSLEIDVVGVSFHVGSGASDPLAFVDAVKNARQVFDIAEDLGMPPMSILDIGGGFVHETLEATAAVLNPCLDQYFPRTSGVKIIAEPGRYFVSNAFTLAVNVVSRRVSPRDNGVEHHMLYINDGVYANMNCIIFDHQEPVPKILSKNKTFMYSEDVDRVPNLVSSSNSSETDLSDVSSTCSSEVEVSVWGPTCDGIDLITKKSVLPVAVESGDWLYFTEFGAYTLSASTTFNGFNEDCKIIYVTSDDKVKTLLGWS